jgi:hypothetical protein
MPEAFILHRPMMIGVRVRFEEIFCFTKRLRTVDGFHCTLESHYPGPDRVR